MDFKKMGNGKRQPANLEKRREFPQRRLGESTLMLSV